MNAEGDLRSPRRGVFHGGVRGGLADVLPRPGVTRRQQRSIDEFLTPRGRTVERVLNQDLETTNAAGDASMISGLLLGPLLSRVLIVGSDQHSDELVATTVRLALDQIANQTHDDTGK